MTPTEQCLIEIYGASTLNTAQLAREFHMKDSRVVLQLVYKGKFPVRTYKLGSQPQAKVVADVAEVAAYLDSMRSGVTI